MISTAKVKLFTIQLTNRSRLIVRLRRFRTDPSRRSGFKRQLVLPFRLFKLKEVCLELKQTKRRPSKNRQQFKHLATAVAEARLTTVVLILAGLMGFTYFYPNLSSHVNLQPAAFAEPQTKTVAQPPVAKVLSRSQPLQLVVKRLGINAKVASAGLWADGSLAVPSTPNTVGWYNLSPTPGERGPAIIAGHVDSQAGPSVFWRLREMKPGNTIEIKRADGKTAVFTVTKVSQFAQDQLANPAVYGNTNQAEIRLITCGGTFNTQTRHYDRNTVVFGKLVK